MRIIGVQIGLWCVFEGEELLLNSLANQGLDHGRFKTTVRLVDHVLITYHNYLRIVAPYLKYILEHLAHLRQMRPIILLHLEDAGSRVQGQDHEIQRLGEAWTLTNNLLRSRHNLSLTIVEKYGSPVLVFKFFDIFIDLEKRFALRG